MYEMYLTDWTVRTVTKKTRTKSDMAISILGS